MTACSQAHPKHGSESPVKSLQSCIGSQEQWHIFRKVRAQHHKGSCPDELHSSGPRHYLAAPLQCYNFTWREKNSKRIYSKNIHQKKEQAHNLLPQKEESSNPVLSIFLLLPCPFRISESLLEKSLRDFLSFLQMYLYRFKEMKAFGG